MLDKLNLDFFKIKELKNVCSMSAPAQKCKIIFKLFLSRNVQKCFF